MLGRLADAPLPALFRATPESLESSFARAYPRSVGRNTMLAIGRGRGRSRPIPWLTRRVQPMLVLTRKPNQSIMIGDDIEVSVLSVVGEKVRIGIHAPHNIPVFRTE